MVNTAQNLAQQATDTAKEYFKKSHQLSEEEKKRQDLAKMGGNYITANRFYVEIDGSVAASFTECSGLDVQIDKEVYQEGGVNDQQRIFLKPAKFNDVTLKRGMSNDITFWSWVQQVLDLNKPKATKGDGTRAKDLRRNVAILVFNQAGETMQAWTLLAAIPVAWKTPSLQADSSTVAIEEITLAYEGLKVDAQEGKKSLGNPGTGASGVRDDYGYFGQPKAKESINQK